jgi:hypothetical protein
MGGGISALQVAVLAGYAPAAKNSALQSKMLVKHHSIAHLKPEAQIFRMPT